MKLLVKKRPNMHILNNEDKDECKEDYVERKTAGATKRIDDAETAMMQEQDDMRNAEKER
jgi:hypothetical protein